MVDSSVFLQNVVTGESGVRVEVRPDRGRSLVASKQIEVGDTILEERPAAWGPKQLSPVCCVACCAPLTYHALHWCQVCGLPLCGARCPSLALHTPECELMAHARDMLVLNSDKDVQQVYYFLTVLRCLWLRDTRPEQWAAVNLLVSNLEHRRGTKVFNFNQTYVVDTLEHFGVTQFSELEVQTICAIFDSNAFESTGSRRVACRGLYLMSSLINSSCLPNTRHFFKDDGTMSIVATRPIYPGAEILGCYTQPRWGTSVRQKHLLSTKYFRCGCPRCCDPGECGALSSALRCPAPDCPGPVLPRQSLALAPASDWACLTCGAAMAARRALTTLNCGAQLVHMRDKSVESSLSALDKLSAWFMPSHYTVMEVKMCIIKEWGDTIRYESLDTKHLWLKLECCEELEKTVNVLEGSMSRTKGFILKSLLDTLYFMKDNSIHIDQERQKKISVWKKEMREIFKNDGGAPIFN